MAEQENNRAGLQKKVSSVFQGVPIPKNDDAQQPSSDPAPDRTGNIPPEPVSPDLQTLQSPLIKKLQQSEESFEEAAGTKEPEIKIKPIVKTTAQSLWQQIKNKLFAPKPGVSPTRQKAMVILVPVLSIAMIFALRQVLSTAPRKTEGAANSNTPAVAAAVDSDNEIDWQIPEPLPALMRDPIKLPEQSDTQKDEQNDITNKTKTTRIATIKDIVYSADKPSAVIGNLIVYVGDKVNDATIIKINRDSVEFERDGKRWVRKIHE